MAIRFRRLVAQAMVAGWVSMAVGVALFSIEGGVAGRHYLAYPVYAIGFCLAAVSSLLTAIRLRLGAFLMALLFAGLGVGTVTLAVAAGMGVGASCKGGCPPDYARASQGVAGMFGAGVADLVVAAAILVLALILALIAFIRWAIDPGMEGYQLAARFRRLVPWAMVAGWVSMAVGLQVLISEGGIDGRHDLGFPIYAAGFCLAAVASLLTAVRLRLSAFLLALPFAGLGVRTLTVALAIGRAVGANCRGGCPPALARESQGVGDMVRAGYADLVVAAAIVVLALILAIVRRAVVTTPPASSCDAEHPT